MTAWLVVAGSTLQVVGVCFAALGIHQVRKSWTDRPGISGTYASRT
jgi:spore maturation protein SpmB